MSFEYVPFDLTNIQLGGFRASKKCYLYYRFLEKIAKKCKPRCQHPSVKPLPKFVLFCGMTIVFCWAEFN